MKFKKTNKKILLIPTVFIAILVVLFAIPISNGRSIFNILTYKDEYYASLSAARQNVYDKLVVKDVKITERKTGTEKFNTPNYTSVDDGSIISNMEGIDVSENDDYVRTFDVINYTIEVSIEKNSNVTEDILKGGVIKVKATMPKDSEGRALATWLEDVWMTSCSRTDDYTVINAQYIIPENQSLVGGSQTLTFRLLTSGYTAELLSGEQKPTFEVWMEGNKPDNKESSIESVTQKDERPMYISGKENYEVKLVKGKVNLEQTVDGVVGQYINFGIVINLTQPYKYISGLAGVELPKLNNGLSKIRLDYYYKDLRIDPNNWNLIDENNKKSNGLLNGTSVVAANNNKVNNEDAKPFASSNESTYHYKGDQHCGAQTSGGVFFCSESGDVTATISEKILNVDYSNIVLPTLKTNTGGNAGVRELQIVNNAIELFVPHYDIGNSDYEYKLVATIEDTYLKNETEIQQIFQDATPNDDTITQSFERKTGNEVLPSINITERTSISSTISAKTFSIGGQGTLSTKVEGGDSIFYGGYKNLITWNNKYFYITVSSSNNSTTEKKSIKYGVYRYKPSEGLTDDEKVNTTLIEDFIWYDSYAKALEDGSVAAVLYDDREWQGYGQTSYFSLNINATNDIKNAGNVPFFRQKLYFYRDEARKEVYELYTNNEANSFIPATYTDQIITVQQTPLNAGASTLLISNKVEVDIRTIHDGTLTNSAIYDTSDEIISYEIKPSFIPKEPYNENTKILDTVEVVGIFNSDLKPIESTITKKPEKIVFANDGKTYIFWVYENVYVGDELEPIYLDFAINPFLKNNTSNIDYAYVRNKNDTDSHHEVKFTSSTENFNEKYSKYDYCHIRLSSLSGSSTRKKLSKTTLETNESFIVTDTSYNASERVLENVKTIQRLPYNGDIYGSTFEGTYSIKINNIDEEQKVYYTTESLDKLNIVSDEYGNLSAKDIDFTTDSNWQEATIGEILPSGITFIATTVPSIAHDSSKEFSYIFIPSGNTYNNKYMFRSFMTTDNLTETSTSFIQEATVSERIITGKVFIDENENNIYDKNETLLSGLNVNLLDENKNILETTTTDELGYYNFRNLKRANYYVQIATSNYYDIIEKNAGIRSVSNVFNENGETDLIEDLNIDLRVELLEVDSINLGLRLKEATLTVNHYIEDTTSNISPTETKIYKYGDKYETLESPNIPIEYELSKINGNPSGIITGDTEITYYYKLKQSKLIVHHYIKGTTTSLVADEELTLTWTTEYETSPSNLISNNYQYDSVEGISNGIVSGDIEVTYYYVLKESKLIVKHLEYETNNELIPQETIELKFGEEYITAESPLIDNSYKLHSKTENYKGLVTTDTIEVIYYYEKKNSELNSTISINSTDEITKKDQLVNYEIKYSSTINNYAGEGKINIIATLPYYINEDISKLDGGIYNIDNKTITWTILESNIDSYTNSKEILITKNISVSYADLVPTEKTMNTKVEGTIVLSTKEDIKNDNVINYIKTPGIIVIHHYLEGTTEHLSDDIEVTGLLGDIYISSKIEKEGYELVKSPVDKNHIFTEEKQEIIYEYVKMKYNIKTEVIAGDGSITGDAIVFYGENSTDIIIQSKEGFAIKRVIINGIEYEVTDKNTMIIDTLENIKEDYLIQVEFEELIENPNTKTNNKIILLIILTFILGTLTTINARNKIIKYEKMS